jgi:hypothetical protein
MDPIEKLFHLWALSEAMRGRGESGETVWRQWPFKEQGEKY